MLIHREGFVVNEYVFVEKSFIDELTRQSHHPILPHIASDIKYDNDGHLDVTNIQIEHHPSGGSPISDYREYSIYFESNGHTSSGVEYSDLVFDISILIDCCTPLSSMLSENCFSFDRGSFNDDDFEILDFTITIEVKSLSLGKTFVLEDGCISSSFFKDKNTGFSPPRYRYDEFFEKFFEEKAVNDIKKLLLKNIDMIQL